MTTYSVTNKATLVFKPYIAASGALDCKLELASGDYDLAQDETVLDDILVSYGAVTLRVLDHANNTMDVSSDGGTTLWSRVSGASQESVTIPEDENDTTQTNVLIMAKGVTGGVVAQRTQVVIIKHRPVGT